MGLVWLAAAGCTWGGGGTEATPLPTTDTPDAAAPVEPAMVELASARIVVTGDIMMHGMVQQSAREADEVRGGQSTNNGGFDALFADTRAIVSQADLAFANLETPVSPSRGRRVEEMIFNAPPELVGALVSTGFDVVSFANNHVYDQGRPGFVETLDQLDASPLKYVGAGRTCDEAWAARRFDVRGIDIAWIGATLFLNDALNATDAEPCDAILDETRAIASAAAARADGADIVLMSVHWGVEYETAPQGYQIRRAHRMIDGGIDVVVGHHPHVLEPVEVYEASDGRRGVIAYSLGNYVSNQSAWYKPGLSAADQGNPRDGLLLSFRVVKRRYGRGAHTVERTEVADLVGIPLWTYNNTEERDADPVEIRVVPLEARMAELDAELDAATEDADIVRIARERTDLDARWRVVTGIVGPAVVPSIGLPVSGDGAP